ncbi:hypothetical protein M0R45_006425 [Rubus argutus]|uniref:anthranilate synthase n=1 Tax=Rubus argutus TaxID=59490 RepID=A0AAW1YR25_RUBAR
MAATVTSQASLKQPKLLSFSPKTQQNPRPNLISMPSSTYSQLHFGLKLGNGFSAKASMAMDETNLKPRIFEKRASNPIIVIDNYDSFTYNLCQDPSSRVRKNPRGVLISPGPGAPQDSGISLQTVLELGPIVPLFGVCMGLQCIGEAFGGNIVRSPYGVMHGKSSPVYYNEKEEDSLFAGLSKLPISLSLPVDISLVIEKDSFPSEELEITAWTEDGLIMAARHKKYRHLQGVHESESEN